MKNNNNEVLETLRHEYHKVTEYYSYTDLPENAVFEINGTALKFKYSTGLILKNLNNKDSFEGWAMICHRWGLYDKIIFKWDVPSDIQCKEYQNFLYRVRVFSSFFSSWFSVCKENLKHLDQLSQHSQISDKLIVESILDICWHFETSKKIDIVISDRYSVSFVTSGIELTDISKAEEENGIKKDNDTEISFEMDVPWPMLIERWAYLPCYPKQNQLEFTNMEKLSHNIVELIKVGFVDRNIPYPSDY